MSDTSYQNIDISQNNPLGFKEEIFSPPPSKSTKKLSPKIILLIILGIIILFLFITSLIVTSLRKKDTFLDSTPTPTPVEITIPTTSKSLLPEIYQEKFNTIENNLSDDLNIEVPSIDLETGL